MQYIRRHLLRFWLLLLLALCFACMHRVAAFTEPYIFKIIIDEQIVKAINTKWSQQASDIVLLLLLALGVATLSRLASNVEGYIVVKLAKNVGMQVYMDGVTHCMSISALYIERYTSPELISKLQTAKGNIERFVSELIVAQFGLVISIVAVFFYSFKVYWLIAPIVLVSTPLVGLFVSRMNKSTKTVHEDYFKKTNHLVSVSNETFRNLPIIKSLGLVGQEVAKLSEVLRNIQDINLKKVRKVNTILFLQNSVVNIIRNGMLVWVLILVSRGEISVGDFFSLLMCSYLLLQPLQQAGTIVNTYRETRTSLEFLDELYAIPSENKTHGGLNEVNIDSLRFSNVSFIYPNKVAAIKNVSFAVKKGETLGIVGASGAGKSTIIKLLLGLYQCNQGKVLYNEKDIALHDIESLRQMVGYVTQDQFFFTASVRDNMKLVKPDSTDDQILEAMMQAECDHLISRSQHGLDTRLGEGGLNLSGGERQRLAIARALLRKPALLVDRKSVV